jgi:hypothetical protein
LGFKPGKYVITAAQYNTPVNGRFLRSLQGYCDYNSAELLVMPMNIQRGLIPPSVNRELNVMVKKYDARLPPGRERKLNDSIRLKAWPINPQQIRPTTGLARLTQMDSSTIVGSPKQFMDVVANSNHNLPKVLLTTGAVTIPWYKDNRVGMIARDDHVYGAIVVDVKDDQSYQFRHLSALSNGKFHDLGVFYDGNRVVGVGDEIKEGLVNRPEAIVFGDIHVGDTDPVVWAENLRMLELYKPERVVLHDFFNGHSVNHHEKGRIANLAKNHRMHGLNLEKELRLCYNQLEELVMAAPESEIVMVPSNHNEFLDRYLQESRYRDDPQNALLSDFLAADLKYGRNPFKEGMKRVMASDSLSRINGHPDFESKIEMPENVLFLERDEDYKVRGWQLGSHGDKGPNGARAFSPPARERSYGKSVTAHSHSPRLFRNTYIVGTSTRLDLDYAVGPSSWMHTHAMLYVYGRKEAKVQLVNVMNGSHM